MDDVSLDPGTVVALVAVGLTLGLGDIAEASAAFFGEAPGDFPTTGFRVGDADGLSFINFVCPTFLVISTFSVGFGFVVLCEHFIGLLILSNVLSTWHKPILKD